VNRPSQGPPADPRGAALPAAQAAPAGRRLLAKKDPTELAFTLLLVYFFVEYVRPQDRIGVVHALKIGLFTTLATAVMWFRYGDRSVFRDPLIRTHLAFIVAAALTVAFAVNTFWVYQTTQSLVLMFLGGTLPATAFLSDHARFVRFIKAWVIFHIILGITAFQSGGKGPGAFLGDENDLALALNMAVPYAVLMAQSPQQTSLARNLYRLSAGVLIVASVFTWSRGGFLGLIACMGLVWLMSKNKIKNILIICVLGLSVIGGFSAFTGKSVLAEFETIDDPNDSTRRDRIDSWALGWEMFLDNPVMGVGVSNYAWRVGAYQMKHSNFDPTRQRVRGGRAAHSLYFTLMPEMGLAGVVLFLAICWQIVRRMRRIIRTRSDDPPVEAKLVELRLLAKAIIAALGAYLVSGAFISVLYYPHLFYLVGFAVALDILTRKLAGNPVSQPRARRPRATAR